MPYPNGRAPARAIAVAVLSCCTRCPGFRISLLTSGAMGIRTPDLLHAIQRQPVHRSPSAQVTVPASTQQSTGIQTRCGTSLLYGPMPPTACSNAESCSGRRREIPCCHVPRFYPSADERRWLGHDQLPTIWSPNVLSSDSSSLEPERAVLIVGQCLRCGQ